MYFLTNESMTQGVCFNRDYLDLSIKYYLRYFPQASNLTDTNLDTPFCSMVTP